MERFKRTLLIWFGFPVCLGFEMWSSTLRCHPEKSEMNRVFFYAALSLLTALSDSNSYRLSVDVVGGTTNLYEKGG